MPLEYPEEIRIQQAIVKREIEKLARMRTEHLIATGQMPTKSDIAAYLKANGQDAEPAANRKQSRPA